MLKLKSIFFTGILPFGLLLLQSCFPTESDNDKQENPIGPDKPVIIDDPGIIPSDTDPQFVVNDRNIDSLFEILVQRVESLEEAETSDDVFSTDFVSLRRCFAAAIQKNNSHGKANVGYIISALCALNTSSSIKKMVDSIDAYMEDVDDYYYSESEGSESYGGGTEVHTSDFSLKKRQKRTHNQALMRTRSTAKDYNAVNSEVFKKHGIEGLGRLLIAQTPKILLAQTQKPSFPSFLTVSFIQDIADNDIIPILNEIISACNRLEQSNMSLVLTAFDETFELDAGDICIFEAGIRLARAGLGYFTAYNMDIYSPNGSSSMQWINDLQDSDEYLEQHIYRLKEDTLIDLWISTDTAFTGKLTDIVQYNLKRSDFLSLRRSNHEAVYNDLKKIPTLIKTGLAMMKSETDNQDDDLISAGDIFDMDADMVDFSSEMVSDGFTPALAKHFESPDALMDFISEILTNEYTFNETIDGYEINMTVNLSNWFTKPVNNLQTILPKYRLTQGKGRYYYNTYIDFDKWSDNSIYVYQEDIIDIPSSMIETDEPDEWGDRVITLKQNYIGTKYVDSTMYCIPIRLIDDAGNDISFDLMEDMFDDKQVLQKCFPYFNDYTINGLFPRMTTRSSWIDFLDQFYD